MRGERGLTATPACAGTLPEYPAIKTLCAILSLSLLLATLPACENAEGPLERASREIDKAMDGRVDNAAIPPDASMGRRQNEERELTGRPIAIRHFRVKRVLASAAGENGTTQHPERLTPPSAEASPPLMQAESSTPKRRAEDQ